MMLGVFELLILLLIGGLIFGAFLSAGRRTRSKPEGGGFSLGHATLTCPHCQQETTAGKPQCEHCGEEL